MGGSSSPKEDPSVRRMRQKQLLDLADLDEEQNSRIKRMRQQSFGLRVFRGSPDARVAPGNRKGPIGFQAPASNRDPTQRIRQIGRGVYGNVAGAGRQGLHYKRGARLTTLLPEDPG